MKNENPENISVTMKGALSTLDLVLTSMEEETFQNEDVPESARALSLFRRMPEYIESLRFISMQLEGVTAKH